MRVEGAPSTRRPCHPLYESDRFDQSPYSSSRAFAFGELVSKSWGGAGRSSAMSRAGRKRGAGGAVRSGGEAGAEGFIAGGERRLLQVRSSARRSVAQLVDKR